MDQGRQAGGALDAAVVPPLPGERGPAAAERAGLQPREPLAAARPADADRHVVADQPPATPRQDGWALGETRAVLLALSGREPSDPTPVRVDAPADLGLTGADRLTGSGRCGAGLTQNEHRQGEVSEKCGRWRVRRPEVRSPRRGLEVTTEATGTFEQEQSSRCRLWPSWEVKSEMSAEQCGTAIEYGGVRGLQAVISLHVAARRTSTVARPTPRWKFDARRHAR